MDFDNYLRTSPAFSLKEQLSRMRTLHLLAKHAQYALWLFKFELWRSAVAARFDLTGPSFKYPRKLSNNNENVLAINFKRFAFR